MLTHRCEEGRKETLDIVSLFFLFFFNSLHGEDFTGAFRSVGTKGTWGPLSNRCVRSGKKRKEQRNNVIYCHGFNLLLNM